MKKLIFSLFTTLLLITGNNSGFIRPFHFLMDENDDGSGGGGAGGAGDDGAGGDDDGNKGGTGDNKDEDFDSLPDWAKKKFQNQDKEVKDLRKENASRRTSNKDLTDRFGKLEGGLKKAFGMEEDAEVDLAEQVSGLTSQLQESQYNSAVTEMAYENDIPKDKMKFFKYLLNEAMNNVGEEEELPEEVFKQIVQDVKGSGKGNANTGTEGNGENPPNGDENKSDFSKLTAEQFVKLSDTEKNKLFKTDRARYDSLFADAKQRRLFR